MAWFLALMAVGELSACNIKDAALRGAPDARAEVGADAAATDSAEGDSSVSPPADTPEPYLAGDSANGGEPSDESDGQVAAAEASAETGGNDGVADVGDSWNGDSQPTLDGGDAVDGAEDGPPQLSEAIAEAGPPDARSDDGASGGATESVLRAARGDACLQCARDNHCLDTGKTCEALTGQAADAGARLGESREQLCLDTLACVLTSRCFETGNGVGVCICGRQGTLECTTSGPLLDSGGDCVIQEQAGLESSDPSVELHAQKDPHLGGGLANLLALCVRNVPCLACL